MYDRFKSCVLVLMHEMMNYLRSTAVSKTKPYTQPKLRPFHVTNYYYYRPFDQSEASFEMSCGIVVVIRVAWLLFSKTKFARINSIAQQ